MIIFRVLSLTMKIAKLLILQKIIFFKNKKHLEIFDLSKENRFNLTGEFTIEVEDEKQHYKLVAIHPPNRTIEWTSDYISTETKTLQSSKIELAKNVWFGYKIEISNHTKIDSESQEVVLNISYPEKDISVKGLYFSDNDSFDTDLNVEWIKNQLNIDEEKSDERNQEILMEVKTVQTSFQWKELEKSKNKDHQSIVLVLKHPSFEKDVTLKVCVFKFKF
jgi:hypothetical protein